MSSVTYQTKVPDCLTDFCEAMGQLFGQVERHLYQDLEQGKKLKDLKREYQVDYRINARQFNSIHACLKGKLRSLSQSHQRQIKQLSDQIKGLEKTIKKLRRKLKTVLTACGYKKYKSPRELLRWQLHQKKRRLNTVKNKLASLKTKKPSIIFGGRKLWKAQFNQIANGYSSQSEWLGDWRASRSSQFMLVGSKDEKAGCQNCQLSTEGKMKIRVPLALKPQFGDYVVADGIKLAYGQDDINHALAIGQALTYRFVRKKGQWYIFCTTKRRDVPLKSLYAKGMLGVDLNPSVIGWAYCDREGNLKAAGQIKLNLRDRSTNQVKATIGDGVKQLVDIASFYQCPITIERLDFSQKKASMREQGIKYSRMLSNFAYSVFAQMLLRRASRWGIEVIQTNPAFSSLIGYTKFMSMYGLSSDTAAALVLARRTLKKSERIPANLALGLPEDKPRHSWSYWNALAKKLKAFRRHDFFAQRVANSESEVNLSGEEDKSSRLDGKPIGTSDCRWDSGTRMSATLLGYAALRGRSS